MGAVHGEIPLFEPGAGSAASAGMTVQGAGVAKVAAGVAKVAAGVAERVRG